MKIADPEKWQSKKRVKNDSKWVPKKLALYTAANLVNVKIIYRFTLWPFVETYLLAIFS